MHKKIILDNGIPLVMETSKEMRSICIGIWIKAGSRNESSGINGISHFLEHMFFKGTAKRSAKDIAVEIDSLGGELNAFTSRENTTFYIKVLDENTDRAIELLTDIFLNSDFPSKEIEKEKGVVLEEIKLAEDSPEDYIYDLFNGTVWGENGLGQPVLGTRETISAFKKDDLLDYIKERYSIKNLVVACSGNFNDNAISERINLTVGTMKRNSVAEKYPYPEFHAGVKIVFKKLSEVQLCLGIEGLPLASPDRYTMHLLNTILGAGFSSRLFQEIREKRGLAYSVGSFNASYTDTGAWTIYTGTDRKHVNDVINIITDQMRQLSSSLTGDELQRAKNQLKGNLLLSLESASSKMSNIARQEIYYKKYFSPEDIIKAVENVSLEDMKRLSDRLIGDNFFALTVYGPIKEKDVLKNLQQDAFNLNT